MVAAAPTLEVPRGRIETSRVESIDLLRGTVMIIMALDHVRDYFHADSFLYDPLDLEKTNVLLFLTRWVTHFCAPVFVFLAGTSAYLVGTRKGKTELSVFLLKRGFWLILLEVTAINFGWFFNVEFSLIALIVIWALGIGMLALAAAIHLPFKMIILTGLILIAGHNLLDGINFQGNDLRAIGWSLLHQPGAFQFDSVLLFVGYPVLPWTGIMLLGYCFGALYKFSVSREQRKKMLTTTGIGLIVLFMVLRFLNSYGDPSSWAVQPTFLFTVLSFINVSKYPPSLLYILITLGPALIFLAHTEKASGKIGQHIVTLGRVPMFYYILHIYLIHVLAMIAALATGFDASDMVFDIWVNFSPNLKGYGFNLIVVYLVWMLVVLILYPLCRWYDRYKKNHKEKWWLSYL